MEVKEHPITPHFHQLIATQQNISLPFCILNIGGISNITIIKKLIGSMEIFSKDIGPGNCLIDEWIRNNSIKNLIMKENLQHTEKLMK